MNEQAARSTQADDRFKQVVKAFFDRFVVREPVLATFLGIHTEDGRLADTTREAKEAALQESRRFLADVEAIEASELSAEQQFERDLAIHAARRWIFDDEIHHVWERRASAMDEVGDGLFSLFARDFAPLPERLASMTSRLEEAPRVIDENRRRLGDRPVRLWNELELESAGEMGSLFEEILAAGRGAWGAGSIEQRRLEGASQRALGAIEDYRGWLQEVIGSAGQDFPLGGENYEELVRLRGFDGLDASQILEIGVQQLADNKSARARVARQIDPDATEAEVLDRVKSNHPTDFQAALEAYREAMFRARDFVVERDLATLPEGEALEVIATPDYLRNVLPFAAYFSPGKFDERPSGIYVVTPSVDGDASAMREHNYSSVSNTSIHEAYPGHHLQLSAANAHPSLLRILVDAPEFVEGWGMYSEQMMREEGFDAGPEFMLMLYTDAIWRSCRIILDVRLHRGEIGVDEAIDFLVEHTGFERPNATAEVRRYTYTPTYQLSYLLGKVLLLRLREEQRGRLGDRFSLKRFHDAMLYAGSLPISFQRRLLQGIQGD
ncbi:MAG: DUF885 domain-containing protein [Chloroflexi bacterium]|nr:DUF885 domain-containing protein [Chloroflexota bacterium]